MSKKNFFILLMITLSNTVFSQEPPPARVVTMASFEKEIAITSPMVGIVDYDVVSSLSPEVAGLIKEHFYREGDMVKKGDVLVRLSTDFIEKDIEILQKKSEQIDVSMQKTEKNLKRLDMLFKNDATSEKDYDDEYFLYNELIKQKEELSKEIEKLQLQLDKSVIHAPFDGLVMENLAEVGQWVAQNTPVCTLANTDELYVKVPVSEDILKYLVLGENISLKITALDMDLNGRISRFVPVADLKSKTVGVKIKIPFFEHAVQNMSARVSVPVSERRKLVMLKRAALVNMNNTDFVYTIEDNTAKLVPISIATYEGEYFGVDQSILSPGITVVIDGNDRLRPGQPVQVIEEK